MAPDRSETIPNAVVAFHAPAGLPVAARLVEADDRSGVVVIDLDPQAWETVDLFNLFNLEPIHRGPGRVSGAGDVRVELRQARPDGCSASELARALVARSVADPDDPLLDTERWLALSVTESVRDEGPIQLRTGFATHWRDERPVHPLLDEISAFFTARDAPMDRLEGPSPTLSGDGDGANGSWLLTIRTEEAARLVTLESVGRPLDPALAVGVARAVQGVAGARLEDGRLLVTDQWTAPPGSLDEDGFAAALGAHLARTDALLKMPAVG